MIAKRIILLAALLIVICASSAYVPGQQPSAPTPKKLNKIVYEGDMAALLSTLAEKYNVDIGLETDPSQLKARIKIDTRFDTVEDVLDAIVQAAPKYQWRNRDTFIDVYPQETSCPLLDVVVNNFQFTSNDWVVTSEASTNLPEVQSQMEAMRLVRRDFTSTARKTDVAPFPLNLENVTLRRALHEIAKKSGNRFWIFQRYGNKSELFSIINSAR